MQVPDQSIVDGRPTKNLVRATTVTRRGTSQGTVRRETFVTKIRATLLRDTVRNKKLVLDSGASQHMVSDAAVLKNLRRINEKRVALGDSTTLLANMEGDTMLRTKMRSGSHIQEHDVYLRRVLLVPEIQDVLISCSALCDDGIRLDFETNGCTGSKNGNVLLRAQRDGGLTVGDSGDDSATREVEIGSLQEEFEAETTEDSEVKDLTGSGHWTTEVDEDGVEWTTHHPTEPSTYGTTGEGYAAEPPVVNEVPEQPIARYPSRQRKATERFDPTRAMTAVCISLHTPETVEEALKMADSDC
ncbi:hypothetical protein FGB62_134g016 [Gracilaria domingensis]|nr:hypothetical protein FGB62_134g016 [Gracilaria domingensis]